MKKHFLVVLLLTTSFAHLTAQTTISLTFTAEVNGIWVPLDSIRIENISQGGDTTLYGTDTLLTLDHGIGIDDRVADIGNQMILYPAYPNPVTHTSTIRLWLPNDAPLTLRLFDLPGRELATFSRSLGAGEHTFTLTPGRETSYLLVAEGAGQRQVQKLINLSPGDGNSTLNYTGFQPATSTMRKGKSTFPWAPGDDLRFVGFSSSGADTIDDNPVQNTIYTFLFLPPVADFSVSDTLIFVNDTVHFTDLSTGNPTSWKWFFGDGDSSLMQNPSHIYTTTGVYSVTLIVSNASGSDTLTRPGQIKVLAIYPPGTVHCNPANPTAIVDVYPFGLSWNAWMDRNLGATQVATSSTDSLAYGDLYQWGRFSDGHQCRNSPATNTLSSSDVPGHGSFILTDGYGTMDWRIPQNNNLWQGVNGVNNPCPTGYRLPTQAEWNSLKTSMGNAAGAFASPLKLIRAGYRSYLSGDLEFVGGRGSYWTSTIGSFSYGFGAYRLHFDSTSINVDLWPRAMGRSIRCIKD